MAQVVVVNFIKFGSDVRSDFEYYLGRVDKIFLDKDGNFKSFKRCKFIRN